VKVSFGIYKIVGCRKKNVGVQEEEASNITDHDFGLGRPQKTGSFQQRQILPAPHQFYHTPNLILKMTNTSKKQRK